MCPSASRCPFKAFAILGLLTILLGPSAAAASSSADELVRQAREHEAAHEDDVALRRYSDALTLDRTDGDAWLGLGALRMKLGENVEAERVFDTALAQLPTLHSALEWRARARWILGRHAEAEADMAAYVAAENDTAALRELAGWFGADGRLPAQLAAWRRLRAVAKESDDAAFERETRRMVHALTILVDGADPVSSPVDPDGTRRVLASIAERIP